MQCLRSKGYSRTTARDIAAASGANLASIGYHFGSKEALLNEAVVRTLEQRNRHMGRLTRASADRSSLGPLHDFLRVSPEVFKAPRPLFVAFVEALVQAEHSHELHEQMTELYRATRRGLEDDIRAGLNARADRPRSDPAVMAWVLLAALDGLVLQWLLDNDAPSGDELIAALIDIATLLQPASVDSKRAPRPAPRRRNPPKSTKRQARALDE